ncbi:MAG: TIGR00269 family protein [Candidatus Bathyarchaeota archaeon]|nr:MAG: TIGR00269 family protein [Candidatus Bathyarchaeota archaeon]
MLSCTVCSRKEAAYTRHYSGEKLCGRCFSKSIEAKVQTTISKYEMLEHDDKIVLAISGGKDSVTLLHILAKFERTFPQASLSAIIVDEGIRGYRDEAMMIAEGNCRRLGVEYRVVSFKSMYGLELDEIVKRIRQKEDGKLTPCSYCGVLRRKAINTAAREEGADKLATAHSLDDETQTMILNIIHGDPLRTARVKPALPVIHPKLVQRVKPLCEVLEREVAFYAYLKKIEFQSIACPYAGTALRSDVRDMLNRMEQKHPGTKYTIFRSMERIRPALEAVTKQEELQECKICGEPTLGEICRSCQMLNELHAF